MNLESVQAEIRQRHPWEAADLGVAMARREWKALLGAWCLLAVPLMFLLVATMHRQPFLACLLFLWMKPLLSVMPLFTLSRRLFGVHPARGEKWRAAGSWLLRRGWLELTVLRFGPRRCLIGTVRHLEGMNSPAHRLNLFRSLTPGSIIFAGLFVQIALWFAAGLAGSWLMPESWMPWHEGEIGFEDWWSNGVSPGELDKFGLLLCGSCFVAATIAELLYAAASFGCYLNVRTEVEGWDVEILFKRMTQRLQRAAGVIPMLLILGCVLTLGSPGTARAAEESAADRNARIARQVTADEDFKIHRGDSFRALEREEEEKPQREDTSGSGERSRNSPDVLSSVLTGGSSTIAISIVAIVAALLILWIVKTNWNRGGGLKERTALRTVAGMDVSVESLPTDPLSVARRLYAAGEPREALSLLYRSALSWLVHRAGVAFRESDTEGDCLRRTDGLVHHAFFRTLTRAWQDTAYASMPPLPPAWEGLCAAWPFHENTSPAESRKSPPNGPGGPVGPALAGTAAVLLCLFLTACGDNLKGQKVEETYGFRGEARTNHFLALERFASRTGGKVTTSFSLLRSLHGEEHRVLVVTPAVLQSRTHADELIKAVERGRHAIVSVTDLWEFEETGWQPTRVIEENGAPKKEPLMLDEDTWEHHRRRRAEMERDKLRPEDDDDRANAVPGETPEMRTLRRRAPGLGHLLQQFRVDVSGNDEDFLGELTTKVKSMAKTESDPDKDADTEVEEPEDSAEAEHEPDPSEYEESAETIRRLQDDADWGKTYAFRDKRGRAAKESRVLVLSRGYGTISFVPSLRPFTNLRLANGSHATLWNALIDGNGTAAIVRGSDISLWDLVKEQGWRPLIGCVLALILWLWACQRRFGLRKRAEVTELLSSAGALQASGEFLWNHGLTPEMIRVWQERIRSRWRLAGHPADALVPAAAAATGLPESQVAECFAPLKRLGQRQFTELARRLHKIEHSF